MRHSGIMIVVLLTACGSATDDVRERIEGAAARLASVVADAEERAAGLVHQAGHRRGLGGDRQRARLVSGLRDTAVAACANADAMTSRG